MDLRETIASNNAGPIARARGAKAALAASLLLILFVALSLSASLRKSPASDEPFHLFAGYAYLKWGDYRINPEHPPLAKSLAALPLLALDINDDL